jgi:hypothetical protein
MQMNCSHADRGNSWPGCGGSNNQGPRSATADVHGIDDLIIGVPGGSVTGSNGVAYVYVLYGKSSGWTSAYALSNLY